MDGLITCTLPKGQWTHAAHFAAVPWLLRRQSSPTVELRMPALIRRYNEAVGGENTDTAGYHETITLASVAQARRVLTAHDENRPLHEVLDTMMETPLGRSDWLLTVVSLGVV